ncbi:MAG: hypothetical protein AAF629_12960 [Chloroflexota bacterium]
MTATYLPQLRPLSVAQLLDQAVRLYRNNFLTFVGILAIVLIPLTILQLLIGGAMFAFTGNIFDPANISNVEDMDAVFIIGFLGIALTTILSIVLIQGLATAALTRAVASNFLGETIGIMDAYRLIGNSWLSLLLALFLSAIIAFGLFIWFLIPCVGWLTGLGILMFFGLVIVPLIAPIIVLEKQAASKSIRRSWDLSRRRFWPVFGFVLVLALFSYLIIGGPASLVTFVTQIAFADIFLSNPALQFILQTVLQSVVSLLGSLIFLPLQLTAYTLLYLDLRVRTEGLDLEILANSLEDDQQHSVSETFTAAPTSEKGNLVTMTEMGYFVLIELGGLALYALLVGALIALGVAFGAASGGF